MSELLAGSEIAPLPMRNSLRAKGFVATMALLGYVFVSVVYVAVERSKIYDSMQTLQALSRHEKALALAESAVSGAVVDVKESSSAALPAPALPSEITLYMETCAKLFAALDEFDPQYAVLQRAIARSYANLVADPVRSNWIDLREALTRAADALEIRHQGLSAQRDDLTSAYQRQYDAVTVESLLLSLLGIALFGAMVAWFFSRLTSDIRRLESHARQIVHGARGVSLPVVRQDELGRLMQAVNQMSSDLDQREKQIELETERRSHQDKMLAVGALAAGVAHEVNNPLAVIAGMAQELSNLEGEVAAGDVVQAAQVILAQSERAAYAARNLAELAAPQPTSFDWVDINAMVRRVLQLMGYDKRYRNITFDSNLALDVPAVQAPGAAIQQVLMQLLTLGCDAIADTRSGARVHVHTRPVDGRVEVAMEFPAKLDFTRAQVQRGLMLVRAIVEPLRVRLELDQVAGQTQQIKLTWPAE